MLFEKFSYEEIAEKASERFGGYPKFADRRFWENADERAKKYFLSRAEKNRRKTKNLPLLTATGYAAFHINGNRSRYEKIFFEYNDRLIDATLAECLDGKGRFLDDVIDLLYAVCSIPVWCVPAHNIYYNSNDPLGDVSRPFIDLFSSEIASTVAHTLYFLGDELENFSPNLTKFARRVLRERIVDPFIGYSDCWWMGYRGETMNNWSPWIIANVLRVVILGNEEKRKKKVAIEKSCDILDRYLSTLPTDGECTEGCGYWDVSVGATFDCAEILKAATRGEVDIARNDTLRALLRYLYNTSVGGGCFVNFGDNSAFTTADYKAVYRFAVAAGDEEVAAFAIAAVREENERVGEIPMSRHEYIRRAFPSLVGVGDQTAAPPEKRDVLYEKSLLFISRAHGTDGFMFAAKGRRADKGHGHLDAGSFDLYKTVPVIIDVGTGVYTKQHFSHDRYDLWTHRSEYHNVPIFNGAAQTFYDPFEPNGKENNFFYDGGSKLCECVYGDVSRVGFDLTRAYGKAAGLKNYLRSFTLDKTKNTFTVEENVEFSGEENETEFVLMSATQPIFAASELQIGEVTATIGTDCEYSVKTEAIATRDPNLRSAWGENVWRTIIRVKSGKNLKLKLIFV